MIKFFKVVAIFFALTGLGCFIANFIQPNNNVLAGAFVSMACSLMGLVGYLINSIFE